MYNGFSTHGTIELVEQNHRYETQEELGQRHGHLIHFPLLRDRIALQVGTFLIHLGKKMTASSQRRIYLSEEPA